MMLKRLFGCEMEMESRGPWTRLHGWEIGGCPRTMSELGECIDGHKISAIGRGCNDSERWCKEEQNEIHLTFHFVPFAPIKQMRHKEVVIASGSPHDDRYAEKPPEKRSLVRPAEKRRLRR